LIAAGGSNLSYVLSDTAKKQYIMRRGPVSARLSKAHDMGREWRVMRALEHLPTVPVPKCIAYCEDPIVNGSAFYVMELVTGRILRSSNDAGDMDPSRCAVATSSLIDAQATLHLTDIDAIGLADLSSNHDNYVGRQLARWCKQAQASSEEEPPKLLLDLYQALLDANPGNQAKPSLVHGDYRFDNVVLGEDDRVKAILDWELSTIGDPVADFYWSLLYWNKKEDAIQFIPNAPTLHDGFAGRDVVIRQYRERTGFDLSAGDYLIAFGYWKMACIVYGVYHRLRKGAGGGMKTGPLEPVWAAIENYLQASRQQLQKL
jgi:aminoglycoside phosphotransferase (APT) family kinase protein